MKTFIYLYIFTLNLCKVVFGFLVNPKRRSVASSTCIESTPPVPVSWEIHEVSEGQL